jgi:hypothetical protein
MEDDLQRTSMGVYFDDLVFLQKLSHSGANGVFRKPGKYIIMSIIAMEQSPMMSINIDIYMYLEKCFTVK